MDLLRILSLNLHGFNNSEEYLKRCLRQFDLIFVQEHWQHERNFSRFNGLSQNHLFTATDSMKERMSQGVMYGRPYGGTACFWPKALGSFIKPIVSTNPRVSILKISVKPKPILCFNIYMPYLNTAQRVESIDEFADTLGYIEAVLDENAGCDVFIVGDYNFEFVSSHPFEMHFNDFAINYSLRVCDSKEPHTGPHFTFYNEKMEVYKYLDHFAVSDRLCPSLTDIMVRYDADNLSDHNAITCNLRIDLDLGLMGENEYVDPEWIFKWERYSTDDISKYCYELDQILDTIHVPIHINCHNVHCNDPQHRDSITAYYHAIMNGIRYAAGFLPKFKKGIEKGWWNSDVERAKDDCIEAYNLWRDNGRPMSGPVFLEKSRTKLFYKRLLKQAKCNEDAEKFDKMASQLAEKNSTGFWKGWKQLNGIGHTSPATLEGCSTNQNVAEKFRSHFQKVSMPNNPDRCREISDEFYREFEKYRVCHSCTCNDYHVNFNNVVDAMFKLKPGKASNCDFQAENFLNGTARLYTHLSLCFEGFLGHGFVPREFQIGTVVPLIKDRSGNTASMDNYRGVTLSPIISKVFESILMDLFGNFLHTSCHQFGFKTGSGTADALFTFKRTVDYFVERSSNVFTCFVDSSKAFDRVVHHGLYLKLMKRGIPLSFLLILMSWYDNLMCKVRWCNAFSSPYRILAGVKQGGIMSPPLYNVYVDDLILEIKKRGVGCTVGKLFAGILIYADDIALLSPSMAALQVMLDICTKYGLEWDICFNASKTKALVIGPGFKMEPFDLSLSSSVSNSGSNDKTGREDMV